MPSPSIPQPSLLSPTSQNPTNTESDVDSSINTPSVSLEEKKKGLQPSRGKKIRLRPGDAIATSDGNVIRPPDKKHDDKRNPNDYSKCHSTDTRWWLVP